MSIDTPTPAVWHKFTTSLLVTLGIAIGYVAHTPTTNHRTQMIDLSGVAWMTKLTNTTRSEQTIMTPYKIVIDGETVHNEPSGDGEKWKLSFAGGRIQVYGRCDPTE